MAGNLVPAIAAGRRLPASELIPATAIRDEFRNQSVALSR